MINKEILRSTRTNRNNNLLELSEESQVLLVFLRHFGCIFCRESLSDLKDIEHELKQRDVHVVLVQMSEADVAEEYLDAFGLKDWEYVIDPEQKLYVSFGLLRGKMGQLFGLKVWSRGFGQALKGNMYSLKQVGDGFQMPGVFVLHNGEIKNMFVHNSIADRPDYLELIDKS